MHMVTTTRFAPRRLNNLAVRNNARYSPPALPLDGRPDEPEILSRLALILYGIGYQADPALVDDQPAAAPAAPAPISPLRVSLFIS